MGEKNLLRSFPLTPRGIKILPVPEPIQGLNGLEKCQLALVGLFSVTAKYKNKPFGIYQHNLGEVNALHKNTERYYDLYAMMVESVAPEGVVSHQSVVDALAWFRKNNPQYDMFYSNYETLLRFNPNRIGDPKGLNIFAGADWAPANLKQNKADVLGDEIRGLLVPSDAPPSRGVHVGESITGCNIARILRLQKEPTLTLPK